MFRFLCKNLKQNLYRDRGLTRNLETQSLKSNSNSPNQHSPTVSYLISSCGLSLDSAISASNKFHIESTEKADSVLQLFKTYGFTNEQITNLMTKYPRFLCIDANKILKPKFEYYESVGFSRPDLVKLTCSDKNYLLRSLSNQIIPTVEFLRRFLHTDEEFMAAFRKCSHVLGSNLHMFTEPNIAILRACGVPESSICKLLLQQRIVNKRDNFFEYVIKMVEEMGFDPKSPYFVYGVRSIWGMGMRKWEMKVEALRSFGWSNEDIISAFRKQPIFMRTSEKKIRLLMDFLVYKLGLKPSYIAKCPNLFLASLEKRIIPRCSVLEFLLSKGLIEKNFDLIWLFNCSNKDFERRYVTKYQQRAPEVVKTFKGDIGYSSFDMLHSMF